MNKTTIYELYDKEDNFICAFPTREQCVEYGKNTSLDGWDCTIKSKVVEPVFTLPDIKPYIPYPKPYWQNPIVC